MKKFILYTLLIAGFSTSCVKNMEVIPIDPNLNSTAKLYQDPTSYRGIIAKLYAGLAVTGQEGPAGRGDIAGIDEGFSSYLRMLWCHQELSTDEAVIGWNDQTIKDFHWQTWGASDLFIQALYSRIFYQITFANEFIRETAPDRLDARGNVSADLKTEIAYYRAEARFLRALSYYHAMDLFGNVPFVTESDEVGAFLPTRIERHDLFDYVESELLAMESTLKAPRANEYGRADQAAVWMLLAKMYLNAEVYTTVVDQSTGSVISAGTPRYDDALTYAKKVIDAGYGLDDNYAHVFMADNHTSPEVIFPVTFDGLKTQTYGGTTFIIHAAVGGNMNAASFGLDGGWAGTRTTSAFVNKFADPSGATDKRAMFFTDGQNIDIEDIGTFTDGYAITKWTNKTSNGVDGSNLTFPDTDYPLFRLAEAYLIFAEAVARGASGGTLAQATGYINQLRERAYGNTNGNITENDLTADFILDERARELYWEATRRTDLIRFGKFSQSTYVWPWKGNVAAGASTDKFRDLFPIPSSDLTANPNLKQNFGY